MGRVGGLEGRDRFNGDGAAGDEGEELRQLGLHLRDVAAVVVEDLLGGGGGPLGSVLMEARKAARSLNPALWASVGHLGGDAGDLVEAEGVDLVWGEMRGGAAEDVVLVALLRRRAARSRRGWCGRAGRSQLRRRRRRT